MTLLTFFLLTSHGQTKVTTIEFKQTYFDIDEKISEIKIKSIQVNNILGLEFYKNNFFGPHLPEHFVDNSYKSQTIVMWNDTTKAKDFESNWTYSFTYDSLSRVTDYNYSGCLICSQLPYRMEISYDRQNRPFVFQIRRGINSKEVPDQKFVFRYDDHGNIIQSQFFGYGKLEKQVDKI